MVLCFKKFLTRSEKKKVPVLEKTFAMIRKNIRTVKIVLAALTFLIDLLSFQRFKQAKKYGVIIEDFSLFSSIFALN